MVIETCKLENGLTCNYRSPINKQTKDPRLIISWATGGKASYALVILIQLLTRSALFLMYYSLDHTQKLFLKTVLSVRPDTGKWKND